ncbi:hypothetical protein BCV72DRAFT_260772 [Rhizopus microsporus var. microsporus]|uniref:Uncharacterized protein n=1 Tax=Rhizopus microsporus var. microsporus TaxID=86635 RepID=A0A1X0RCA1_RHIZD|nr:hypothetical protein BCV72DRAFT_260772 [Rhizopus microsporus var. microsporus]
MSKHDSLEPDYDPFDSSPMQLAKYLADQHTVRKLKSLHSTHDRNDIRTSTIYLEFMKALRSQTIQPTKHWTYNISPAIESLLTLGPNITITEEQLTVKTCWLLAMAGFLRHSDLSLPTYMPPEKRRSQRIVKTITTHPHYNLLLYPVTAFEACKSRIAYSTRITEHPIFPNQQLHRFFRFIQGYRISIGAERISHRIKQIMVRVAKPAQAPVLKARGLAATLAAQAGVSVDNIVAHGFWPSCDIFEHYYCLSSATSTKFSVSSLDQQPRLRLTKCNVM